MAPEPGRPEEREGVLNPATGWTPDGQLVMFPRLVAEGNVSRIGRVRVTIAEGGTAEIEREGIALEPLRPWEHGMSHGGVEDPRITWIDALGLHVMTYVAFGPTGPRTAIAVSRDLAEWRRLGPVQFDYDDSLGVDLNLYPNKDVVFFPEPITAPDGTPCFAALHRPMWEFSFVRPGEVATTPAVAPDDRPAIWISYIPVADVEKNVAALTRFGGHRFVAGSKYDWESLKVGAGPAPIRVPEGWLLIHHGASGEIAGGSFVPQANVRYAAGAILLSEEDPGVVLARTATPLLEPETAEEIDGTVGNVVFPTAIEIVDGTAYVFYGMADSTIGLARLERTSPVQASDDDTPSMTAVASPSSVR
jgi:predicted GH43/DUF377 family glycosyl hydrolase